MRQKNIWTRRPISERLISSVCLPPEPHLLRQRRLPIRFAAAHTASSGKSKKKGRGAAEHTGGWVNGTYDPQFCDFMVDNVATDGGTKLKWANRLIEDGYPALQSPWIILIDRQQGAVKQLHHRGFKSVIVIYNLLDVAFAFGELELWPKNVVRLVEKEIAEHQFA